ncbi:MAG: histidine kinase dimerization/phospho-acceptor domain-containing protein, partial [bacterium]
LLVGGIPVEGATPTVRAIAERLSSLSIASFSLVRGISQKEFGNVVELLQATPDEMRSAGGFAAIVGALGFQHVRSKRVTIQQITEDEMVVSKDKLSQVAGKVDTGNLIKFLKGEIDSAVPGINESVEACAADVHKVGDLVVKAAALPDGAAPVDGAEEVVRAVRRLYDNMAGNASGQTVKGKKALVKFLEQLEGEIIGGLRASNGRECPEADSRISLALEEMKDELRIDSLATEYAKKRSAIGSSEKRILRYIEAVGWAVIQKTGLKNRLMEEGLTSDEREALLEKSGLGDEVPAAASEHSAGEQERSAVAAALANALSNLGAAGAAESSGTPSAVASSELDCMVEQVGEAVARLVDQTGQKIEGFTEKVRATGEGKLASGVSRREILEFLAEIVQELRQPLSVVMSVIDALQSGTLGKVSQQQGTMLALVGTSAERLDLLITKLAAVSGMPGDLSPDARILDAVYGSRKDGDQSGGK